MQAQFLESKPIDQLTISECFFQLVVSSITTNVTLYLIETNIIIATGHSVTQR